MPRRWGKSLLEEMTNRFDADEVPGREKRLARGARNQAPPPRISFEESISDSSSGLP